MAYKKKTHKVLDLVYTPEEGQECFDGTRVECENFVSEQGDTHFTYKIVPMSQQEIETHPDNKN